VPECKQKRRSRLHTPKETLAEADNHFRRLSGYPCKSLDFNRILYCRMPAITGCFSCGPAVPCCMPSLIALVIIRQSSAASLIADCLDYEPSVFCITDRRFGF
jgi:hypothetical protein